MKVRLVAVAGAVVLGAALLAAPHANAATARQWQLTAPGGGGPAVTVALDTAGKPTLSVRRGTTQVLLPSALGIRTKSTDLSTGLTFTTRTDSRVTGNYSTVDGKRRQHRVDANQTTLTFTKGGSRLDVIFRVSADGLGYRYVVHQSGTVSVTGEASEYAVPTSAGATLLPYFTGRDDYENVHVHTTVAAATATEYGYPSLFHVGDTWLLVTESDLGGTYGGTRLTLDRTSRHFTVTLPDPAEVDPNPLTTPWRTLVLGSLATVTGSDLETDLASPSKIADTSWIRPGRAAWSWWSSGSSAGSLTAQEQYTDFAAKMGWEYVLVDAGWDPSWIPTLVRYARARHIGVWIWTNQPTNPTPKEIDANFKLWKSWGVVGLKVDHIRSEQQVRMQWYDQILAASAKYQLMIDFHGSTIPRGMQRTWPQVLTMEGVSGAEHIHDKPGKKPYPANYYTALPFTRNLAGSMDYTPVTFSALRTNTDAAELAQSIVFESALQNYADSIASYNAHPVAQRLLTLVPTVWDDTRLLSGNPDSSVVLARRNGANWYLGAIFAGSGRTVSTSLRFLGAGTWLADVYADGGTGLTVTTRRVTSASTLTQTVRTNGGFSVVLCPAKAGATSCG
jgi:alpha-glucosidase